MALSSPDPMPGDSLQRAAVKVLRTADPYLKARRGDATVQLWRSGEICHVCFPGRAEDEFDTVPDEPSRDSSIKSVAPRDIPRRGRGGSLQSRQALIHSLVHIENCAVDLSWDIIARYCSTDPMPRQFYDDFVTVAEDEGRHFRLLEQRLKELGSHYGAFPVHQGLWETAAGTASSLLARLALEHCVHEARGLDVVPQTICRFRAGGDEESASLLETTVYPEEITHCAAGVRWFTFLCCQQGLHLQDCTPALPAGGLEAGSGSEAAEGLHSQTQADSGSEATEGLKALRMSGHEMAKISDASRANCAPPGWGPRSDASAEGDAHPGFGVGEGGPRLCQEETCCTTKFAEAEEGLPLTNGSEGVPFSGHPLQGDTQHCGSAKTGGGEDIVGDTRTGTCTEGGGAAPPPSLERLDSDGLGGAPSVRSLDEEAEAGQAGVAESATPATHDQQLGDHVDWASVAGGGSHPQQARKTIPHAASVTMSAPSAADPVDWAEVMKARAHPLVVQCFHRTVREHFRGVLKPPFNTEARSKAGFVGEWYLPLANQVV